VAAGGRPGAGDLEDALFSAVREHAESMICRAKSGEALALEHDQLEEKTLAGGYELMRVLAESHMALRAAREQRRDDVVDADGDARATAEDGQEHTRVMIFGPVRTSRIAYRRRGKANLYQQDADLNWAGPHSYSAGVEKRAAQASAVVPFEQAAVQVSAQGAVTLGKRQAEELAIGSVTDFDAFYASRLPEPCPPETGLLITADGSAFPVLPEALRPATAKAAAARAKAAAESGWPDDPSDLRKSRTRTAELACVADIPPAPRTADDILAALFGPSRQDRGAAPRPAPGPRAEGKTLVASARKPISEVIADAFAEADRRDPGHARPWFAVVDGNNAQIAAINALAAERRPTRRQRSYRGRGPLARQGPHAGHRRQVEPRRRRGRPPAPCPRRQRRLRRLLHLPPRTGETTQPRQPLPATPGPRSITSRARIAPPSKESSVPRGDAARA